MKLYNVPKKTWIKFMDQVFFFDHLDGAYSFCQTEGGEIVHLSASCDVEILNDI